MIGDDRERLGCRTRQAAHLFTGAAQQMGEIRRGLEMPASPAFDELDAAAFIVGGELAKRDLDLSFAHVLGDFVDRQRLRRGEEGGFDRSQQLVHQAALSLIGAKASSCAISSLPRRASSRAARKLDARADRRNCGSWVEGRKLSRK